MGRVVGAVLLLILAAASAAAEEAFPSRPPDSRSADEVSKALSDAGIPNRLYGGHLMFLPAIAFGKLPPFLPLSSISKTVTVACSEGNLPDYPLWKMDRYGFNNDDTVYSFKERILIVGDAAAVGGCVHQDEATAGVLRRNGYPASTISNGGYGPLLELAMLTEYGQAFRPKIILWFDQPAPLEHLRDSDLRSAFALQYLKDGFTQNLVDRQAEVDALWKDQRWAASYDAATWDRKLDENLAAVQSLLGNDITSLRDEENLYRIFGRIIEIAKRRAESWGGKIYVVLLPRRVEYQGQPQLYRRGVLDEVGRRGLSVVDVDQGVRAAGGDPLRFFAARYGFFNPAGYTLLARQIAARLDQDSPPQSPAK